LFIRLSSRNAWSDFFKQGRGDAAHEYDFYQAIDKLERTSPEEEREKAGRARIFIRCGEPFIESGSPRWDIAVHSRQSWGARLCVTSQRWIINVIRGLAYLYRVVF